MMHIASKKLILTIFVASLFIIASGLLFAWLVIHVQTVTQGLKEVETEIATHEANRTSARKAEVSLEENKDIVARINNTLINHDRPIDFLEELTNLGKNTGNKIVLDYLEQESSADSLVFRITIDGTKASVLNYLTILELTPYVITIENINWLDMTEENTGAPTTSKADTRLLFTLRVKTAK